jgi:hypothetical protein
MGTPNDYYVHATEGSDATGDGSIGNPFATHIGALATLTQDSTDGDRINITGDLVATATIGDSLGTYGTPTDKAPLIFNGLTDGGLNGNGTYSISGPYTTTACIHYTNLHLHNCGANNVVELSSAVIADCEVDTNAGSGYYGIYLRGYCLATGCYVHGVDRGIYCYNENQVFANYLADIAGTYGITNESYSSHYLHNIISVSGATTGIYTAQRGGIIANNSILSAGGTGRGIYITDYFGGKRVYNNLIEGFSGAGGDGIELAEVSQSTVQFLLANNAVYNCASAYTNTSYGDWIYDAGDNETLSASPFAKKGDNTFANRFEYFRPLNVGNVLRGGYPSGSRMFKGAVPPKFAVSVQQMIHAGVGVL